MVILWFWCRVQCGRCQTRHSDASLDSLATYGKSDCHMRSLHTSRASPSMPSSNTGCLHQLHHHHYHQHLQQHQQQVAGHHCSASPHHDHCQPAPLCLHSRRLGRHGDCRCIYSTADEDDSDTPRRRRRAKPLLAADTDTQTDGEMDDRPPDDVHQSSPDFPLATQRLLMTSSDQLPVSSDNVVTVCRGADLIVTWVGGNSATIIFIFIQQ